VLPVAYAELAALEELEKPHLCPSCRDEWLRDNLEVTCDVCGKKFKDPQILHQLTHK